MYLRTSFTRSCELFGFVTFFLFVLKGSLSVFELVCEVFVNSFNLLD